MTDNRDRNIVPRSSSGFFMGFANRAKLIGRLMMDKRVNPFLKLLPFATLVYLIFPDFPGPVDDALVIWLGTNLFVELCPPQVVHEIQQEIDGTGASQWQDLPSGSQNGRQPNDQIVNGEYYDLSPRRRERKESDFPQNPPR